MSGQREVRDTIAALTERGFESHPVEFNSDIGWQALTWLAVTEELDADAANIAKIVNGLDPGPSGSEVLRRLGRRPRTGGTAHKSGRPVGGSVYIPLSHRATP